MAALQMTERCRLYLITPPKLEPKSFADTLKRALGAGDVACVQLRLKDVSDDEVRRATQILMPIVQNTGAAFILNDRPDLAAELGALSADHLLQISQNGIAALANSDTVAVLLPGTAFYLKAKYAPGRQLIDAGACVAISTDFNPGTCVTLNLPAVMTISALYLYMSRAEIFAAVTYNAAKALGLHARKGTLERGKDADFFVLPYRRFEELYYNFAW